MVHLRQLFRNIFFYFLTVFTRVYVCDITWKQNIINIICNNMKIKSINYTFIRVFYTYIWTIKFERRSLLYLSKLGSLHFIIKTLLYSYCTYTFPFENNFIRVSNEFPPTQNIINLKSYRAEKIIICSLNKIRHWFLIESSHRFHEIVRSIRVGKFVY